MQAAATMRMLLDRLIWPVRFVRWRAAREIAALFGHAQYGRQMQAAFLEWLAERNLEDDVVSGLAVVLCADFGDRPSFFKIAASINRPSILADLMLRHVYGSYKGGWQLGHSGPAPHGFEPAPYFLKHQSSHVPPILSSRIKEIEARWNIPLSQQWAFEWDQLTEQSSIAQSGYPYYFVDASLQDAGVNGQFSQRQCSVYRSAYLRALAFAVAVRGLSPQDGAYSSSYSLPLNGKLARIDPQPQLNQFGPLRARCCSPDANLEAISREAVALAPVAADMRPIALRIPVHAADVKFGELMLFLVLADDDLDLEISDDRNFPPAVFVMSEDLVGFGEIVEKPKDADVVQKGDKGEFVSLSEQLRSLPMGYWLGEYFHAGITIPSRHLFEQALAIQCDRDGVKIKVGSDIVGAWQTWLDHWTPLYPQDGTTNCGSITAIRRTELVRIEKATSRRLKWISRLRLWRRDGDYGKFVMSDAHASFFA